MGLAPVAAALRDRISIFASGDMPFVVRRISDDDGDDARYILLGAVVSIVSFIPCFGSDYRLHLIHEGAMDGEAVYKQGELVFHRLQREHESQTESDRLTETLSLESRGVRRKPEVPRTTNRKRWYTLMRSRSLDSGQSTKALATELVAADLVFVAIHGLWFSG